MADAVIKLANALGMDVKFGSRDFAIWTGKRGIWPTSARAGEQMHEVAHFIVAAKRRRRLVNFGLGFGSGYSSKGRTLSWRSSSWDEKLALTFERGFWYWVGRGTPEHQFGPRFDDEEARHELVDRGLLFRSSSMPNWPNVFLACERQVDRGLVKLIRKSLPLYRD